MLNVKQYLYILKCAMSQTPSHEITMQGSSLIDSFCLLETIPCLMLVKDLQSRIVVVSEYLAYLAGLKNSNLTRDQTDFDIQCGAVNAADMFVHYDQNVIQNKREILTLDICEYTTGWKTLLSSRKPIINENKEIIGVFSQAIDISNTNMFKWCLSLMDADSIINNNNKNKQRIYALNEYNSFLPLTPRQNSCLFLLVRGKSMKEIASVLNISVRTVEEHIMNIKTKLDCHNRSQLIEKALNSGFLNFIPQEILHKKFDF